jgi:mRNA interferase RelE/StbE
MYTVILSDLARTQLKKLEIKTRDRIVEKLKQIRINPKNFLKRLVGKPLYSLRVGDYRVIININENQLQLLAIEIGHRKNVYGP